MTTCVYAMYGLFIVSYPLRYLYSFFIPAVRDGGLLILSSLANVSIPAPSQHPVLIILRSSTRTRRGGDHVQCPRDRLRMPDRVIHYEQLFHDRGPPTSEHACFFQALHPDIDWYHRNGTLGWGSGFRTQRRRGSA